jgi:hypothetical protein
MLFHLCRRRGPLRILTLLAFLPSCVNAASDAKSGAVVLHPLMGLSIEWIMTATTENSTTSLEDPQVAQETFTREQELLVDTLLYVTASLSCLGSLFICVTYLAWKQVRSFGTRLVFFMSLSDFFTAIWYVFAPTSVFSRRYC